jgi:hypothetical protein
MGMRRSDPDEPLIVFVHIPKTAGTMLRAALRINEPGARQRRVGNVFKAGSGGAKVGAEYQRLRKQGKLDGVRLITGHFPLSIRTYLPQDRELRCCTMLREPVDRTISHYFNIREASARQPGQKAWALGPLPEAATLDDAVQGGYLYDNLQTRMLSGGADPFGPVTAEMLENAKRNLTHGLVSFGLSERFDESLVLTRRRLGLRTVLVQVGEREQSRHRSGGRVNPERPRGDEIPREMRRSAERCNLHDLELYRYAQQVFDDAPEPSELAFKIEVAALSAARASGDIDLSVAAPPEYSGDETSWRFLLEASALSLRRERELAEVSALSQELTQHGDDVLRKLAELSPRHLKARCNGEATSDLADMLQLLRDTTGGQAERPTEHSDSTGASTPPSTDAGGDENGADGRRHKARARKRRDRSPARRSPGS